MPVPYMTNIILYSGVPWDNTYTDVRLFDGGSVSIPGKVLGTVANASYQRVNSSVASERPAYTVRVPIVADKLYNCNYLSFNNSNKTFYAFVNKVNFINTNNTELVYEIDEFTTWFYDCTLHPSYVIREHVSEDGDFGNLVPEGITCTKIEKEDTLSTWFLTNVRTLLYTTGPYNEQTLKPAGIINNLYLPGQIVTPAAVTDMDYNLQRYAEEGVLDKVIGVYTYMADSDGTIPPNEFVNIVPPTNVDGYVPRNKKLFSKEFNTFKLCASTGDSVTLFYEDLAPNFQYYVQTGNGPNYEAIATPFYGGELNYNYTISTELAVQSPWIGNNSAEYNGQKKTNMILTNVANIIVGTIAGAMSGYAYGNIAGATAGAITGATGATANALISTHKYELEANVVTPDYHGGITSNMSFKLNRVGFYAVQNCIIASEAKRLDNYFDRYGYKVNDIKVPNTTGRQYFNFVQTKGVCITGDIPSDSLSAIKTMFNNGITLWHTNNVGSYNVNDGNPIA